MPSKKKKKIRYYSPKRRAVYAQGDSIDSLSLFERDNWTCWICRQPINKYLRVPNYWAATVDHIIPLCKGGTHTWQNVAAAHYVCNMTKSDSLPNEFQGTIVA